MTTVTIKNVFIDPNTGTQSGFGFIHFETLEGARAAVNQGANLQIGGVNYTAEFSKHLTKRGEKKDDEPVPVQISTPPAVVSPPPTWVPPSSALVSPPPTWVSQSPRFETIPYPMGAIAIYPHVEHLTLILC